MKQVPKREYRKLSVLLDDDLERRLAEERARINAETGCRVSMTQVAAKVLRAGFEASRSKS